MEEDNKTKNKKGNRKVIFSIILALVIVLAIVVTVIIVSTNENMSKSGKSSKAMNDEEMIENLDNAEVKKEEPLKEIYSKYFFENYDDVYKVVLADLTHDNKDEMIVVEADEAGGYTLKVYTYNGKSVKEIYKNFGTKYHASGFIDMYLYEENGKNYFLNGTSSMWQGIGSAEYEIFSLSDSGEKIQLKSDKVEGDPVDDDEYHEFNKRYSKYAGKSIEIIVTDGPKGINKDNEYTAKVVFDNATPEIAKNEDKKIINKLGNTSSNVHNGGQFAYQGDDIYYANIDGKTLYHMSKKLKACVKIYESSNKISNINVIGNYIYYIENKDAVLSIVKITTGGMDKEELEHNVEGTIYVTDKYIYYAKATGTDKYDIKRMDLNGENKETVVADAPHYFFMLENNELYYCGENSTYKMINLNTQQISDSKVIPFRAIAYKGRIFQIHQMQEAGVFESPIDHTYITEIVNGEERIIESTRTAWQFAIINDKIYYTKEKEDDTEFALFCCELDGSNEKLLLEYTNTEEIYDVDDEYIYYFDFHTSSFALEKISKNQTETLEEPISAQNMFLY